MNELSPIGNFLRVVPSATVTFLGPAEKTFNIRKRYFSSHTSGEVVSEPKHLTNSAHYTSTSSIAFPEGILTAIS